MARSRTLAYIRASVDPVVETVEEQRAIIADYCQRIGRPIDGFYIDRSETGTGHFLDREAGRQLLVAAGRGDHVVFARADCLSRSFPLFAETLQQWNRAGVTVHLCDFGAVLDAESSQIRWLVEVLAQFAYYGRRVVQLRSRENARKLASEGRRTTRFAPFGFKWSRRGNKTYMVESAEEQTVIAKVVELFLEGCSIAQIRQRLMSLKIRNRVGNNFGLTEIRFIANRNAHRSLACCAKSRSRSDLTQDARLVVPPPAQASSRTRLPAASSPRKTRLKRLPKKPIHR